MADDEFTNARLNPADTASREVRVYRAPLQHEQGFAMNAHPADGLAARRDRATTGKVIANFGRVVKGGDIRIHPLVAGWVEDDMLRQMSRSNASITPAKE